jgi:uncharacterized membrane protein YjfL (UPF0719 family)
MLWYNLSICVHYYVIACWLACLHDYLIVRQFIVFSRVYTAISIKVVHEQSGKVEYERERLLGIAKKLIGIFIAIPSSLSRSYSTFPLCSWTTLIEITVYKM